MIKHENYPRTNKTGWPWDIEVDRDIYKKFSNWPKISIVTPSYNQGKFIEETIRSIKLQNYPNIEFIIIDGGSNDNTVDIIKEYEDFISYWISEKDNGQSDAIVKGISKSNGEIINWINSDDILAPNALYHIAITFIENSNIDFVCGINGVINNKSEIIDWIHTPIDFNQPSILFYTMPYGQQSCFFSRSLYNKTSGINTSLHFSMDFDLYVKMHLQSNPKQINNHIGSIRIHELTKTSNLQDLMYYENGCIITTLFHSLCNYKYSSFLVDCGFTVLEKYYVNEAIAEKLLSFHKKIFTNYLEKAFWHYYNTSSNTIAKKFLLKLISTGKVNLFRKQTFKLFKDLF